MEKKKKLIKALELQLNSIKLINTSINNYSREIETLKENLENSSTIQAMNEEIKDFKDEFLESDSNINYSDWLEIRLSETRCLINKNQGHTRLSTHKKNVLQFNLDGSYVQSFNSVTEAAISTGINRPSISEVANGKRKTAGRFKWVLEDNIEKDLTKC